MSDVPTLPIRPGEDVRARDALGVWRLATSTSGVEGVWRDGKKIHDFPVVWVTVAGYEQPVPWPAADVVREAECEEALGGDGGTPNA